MNTYKTAEVAAIIGIHPNTVRLYEELELIPKPERQPNGYRIFTNFHIQQFQLARIAFQIEVLQNGLRKKIVEMVKIAAKGDFDKALVLTQEYLDQLQQERVNAEEAITIVQQTLSGGMQENIHFLKRKEVSEYLNVSMDALRNWEMNGLLTVKRKQNGYRIYTDEDIQRLKIIRSLRCANYSLEAILRMLRQLSKNPNADIKKVLNTPKTDADIITVCDKLIVSLLAAENNARKMIDKLQEMKIRF
ncbi:MerR family transcriptional regulator [Clostridium sp. D2Q-14]|uniref:MerR family transcriptional regulator n=1 Tax=Anaeromonas gelatinilytica TaxID=2683194 RepID=UPI00193AF044|nr:MerR family transcriptional regulator [Anaeromonas gelatinilytica]MBS4535215.1 MerR family transcriptional regulator [Anaeromonas gelatinilytica]